MCSVRKSLPVGHWLDNQWQYLKIAAAWCGSLMGQTRGWLKSWKENLGMSIRGFENLLFYPEGLECKVAVHSCTSLTSGWPRESIQAGNADEVGVVNCWRVKAMPQHTHTQRLSKVGRFNGQGTEGNLCLIISSLLSWPSRNSDGHT